MEDYGNHPHESSRPSEPEWLVRYLNRQGDWLEKTRGNLMVAATVIASMSFQVMVTPPGGVWQDDQCNGGRDELGDIFTGWINNTQPICTKKAGTSVLAYGDKRTAYLGLVISSTVSFAASMTVLLLVISGMRLRNRLLMAPLVLFMVAAVLCMAAAFFFAIFLVQTQDHFIRYILLAYLGFWVAFPALILFIQLVRLLVWFLCLIFCCCRKRRRRSGLRVRVRPSLRSPPPPLSS